MSLRLFLSVTEERNIGRAASREAIAASAVTKRIHDLEDTLGFKLFYRDAKGVVPTPAGKIVERHVRRALQAMDDLHGELCEFSEGTQGHIRIWANESALSKFLSSDLGVFAQYTPVVSFDVREATSVEVLRAVAVGAADIGVCTRPHEGHAKLCTTPYQTDSLVAVVHIDHPLAMRSSVSFGELLGTALVGWSETSGLMAMLTTAAEALGREFKPKYSVSSLDAGRGLVRAGLGIAIEPEGIAGASEEGSTLRIVPLLDAWAHREISIFTSSERPLTAAARALMAHLSAAPGQKIAALL